MDSTLRVFYSLRTYVTKVNRNMRKIISVSLSVLCLVILIFNIEVNQDREAYALSRPVTNTGFNNVQFTRFVGGSGGVNYIATGNFSSYVMKIYNANTTNLISTFNVKSVTPTAYSFNNISCDKSGGSQLCAVGYTSSSSNSGVYLFNAGNSITSTNNTRYTIASNLVPIVSLFNDGVITHVYVQYDDGVGTTFIDTLAMNTTGSLSTVSNRLVLLQHIASNVRFVGAFNQDTMTVTSGTNTGNWIMYMNSGSVQLWSVSQAKRVCGLNLGGGSVGDIDAVIDSTGTYFLISNQVSTLYQVDLTCTQLLATNYVSQLTNIFSISHSSSRGEDYIVGDTNKLLVLNESTLSSSPLAVYSGITSPGIHFNNLATPDAYPRSTTNNGFVVIGGGGNPASLFWFYWQGTGTGGGGGGSNCTLGTTCGPCPDPKNPNCVGQVDCSLPKNANIAECFINQNPKNNNGFSGTAGMFNSSVSSLVCAIGLVACNFDSNGVGTPLNGNVKTNGIGYIIAILGLAVLISIFWVASDHDLRNIPMFVWFIAVLGLLGSMVALGWLDPTFFIVAIMALVGLAVAKAKGVLLGDSF